MDQFVHFLSTAAAWGFVAFFLCACGAAGILAAQKLLGLSVFQFTLHQSITIKEKDD